MSVEGFRDLIAEAKRSVEWFAEGAVDGLSRDLLRLMKEKCVSKEELAKKTGISESEVDLLLRGDLETAILGMARVTRNLSIVVEVLIKDPGDASET